MNSHKKPSLTVGISTYNPSHSLLVTARSIMASTNVTNFDFVIISDTKPMSKSLHNSLTKMGIRVIQNKRPGSLIKKFQQLRALCKTDILLFTQDDILFSPETLSVTVDAFAKDKKLTLLCPRVLPLETQTLVEKGLAWMVNLIDLVGTYWNKGDNYLSASGRCMAFRTSHIKPQILLNFIVNADRYFYLLDKVYGGKFKKIIDGKVFIRCPQTLKEQRKPSSRFQHAADELSPIFGNQTKESQLPLNLLLYAAAAQAITDPVGLFFYIPTFIITRLARLPRSMSLKTTWSVDLSTKKLFS